jgi:4-amino-4-deoxy-L-arabinose transferase-like glycosyltransferase
VTTDTNADHHTATNHLASSTTVTWLGVRPSVWAIACTLAVLLPWLGADGFVDPWETNYAEVARGMVERVDPLYPFWKNAYFFSKPVLLFWLTAPGYALLGAGDADVSSGALSTWIELAGRLPVCLLSLLCVAWVHRLAARAWGPQAGAACAIVLVSMPMWALLSRQAITDMPYVALATTALCAAWEAQWWTHSDEDSAWPRWMMVLVALTTLPQAIVIGGWIQFPPSWGSAWEGRVPHALLTCALLVVMGAGLWWVQRRRDGWRWLFAAWCLGMSCLAKGPVGAGVMGLVLLLSLWLCPGNKTLRTIPWAPATVVFVLVAAPWMITMGVFHGLDDSRQTWFDRFVMYDLLGRVGSGVHGDRGGADYYVRSALFGMLPWIALLPMAMGVVVTLANTHERSLTPARALGLGSVLWAGVVFSFFTLTSTKFHHYILPLAPPAAFVVVAAALHLRSHPAAWRIVVLLLCIAVPVAVVAWRELIVAPWEGMDLFTYHYKGYQPSYYFPVDRIDQWTPPWSAAGHSVSIHRLTFLAGAMLVPLAMLVGLLWARRCGRGWLDGGIGGLMVGAVLHAVVWVQVYFPLADAHWTQRKLVDRYFQERRDASEPLIAFQMDWKGETFYTANRELQVKQEAAELRRLVERPGRDFVVVHTDRLSSMKTAIGKKHEAHVRVLMRDHAKWTLVLIDDAPP